MGTPNSNAGQIEAFTRQGAVVIPPQMKWLASMDRVLSLLGKRASPV
jgi:hypothetical protein